MIRLNLIWVFLSLVVNKAWSLHELNIFNAFLYGDLDEQVLMEQPPRYDIQGVPIKVCLLRRAIYRLKHSPCARFVN